MSQRKWWFPLGLILSGALIWTGVHLIVNNSPFGSQTQTEPGWLIIRPPFDVHTLAQQGTTIWAGGTDGLFRLDQRSGKWIDEVEHYPPFENVRALLVDEENNALWVGHQAGLAQYQDGVWRNYTQQDGLPDSRVNALMLDQAGRLWAGTWGGAAIQDGSGWRTLTQADGLLDNMVNVMLQDRYGGIWFGSYVAPRGGISYLKDGVWQYFDTEHGLPHNNITSFAEISDGDIWVGTGLFDRGGACRFTLSGTEWQIAQTLMLEDGLAGEKVRSIFQDESGALWFGSEYDGVALHAGDAWLILGEADGISHPEIKTILQDTSGSLWLGTRDGLTRISPEALLKLYDAIPSSK